MLQNASERLKVLSQQCTSFLWVLLAGKETSHGQYISSRSVTHGSQWTQKHLQPCCVSCSKPVNSRCTRNDVETTPSSSPFPRSVWHCPSCLPYLCCSLFPHSPPLSRPIPCLLAHVYVILVLKHKILTYNVQKYDRNGHLWYFVSKIAFILKTNPIGLVWTSAGKDAINYQGSGLTGFVVQCEPVVRTVRWSETFLISYISYLHRHATLKNFTFSLSHWRTHMHQSVAAARPIGSNYGFNVLPKDTCVQLEVRLPC